MTIKMTEEKLIEAVRNSKNIAEVLRYLNMSITTASYKQFHIKIKKFNIDIAHFTGQSSHKSRSRAGAKPLKELLVENSNYIIKSHIKKRIIRENLLVYKCYECGLDNWNNKPISLQIDHINGINNDHRIENLRLLCPNCHSQTDTFCGRNLRQESIVPHKPNYDYCMCNGLKLKTSTLCKMCAPKKREKITNISIEIIKSIVEEFGYSEAGRRFGVSPTTIKNKIERFSCDSNTVLLD